MRIKQFRQALAAALLSAALAFSIILSACSVVSDTPGSDTTPSVPQEDVMPGAVIPSVQEDNVTPGQSDTDVAAEEDVDAPDYIQAEVLRVVDGDTIEVSLDGVKEKIRLIGVDTPESVHPDAERNVPYGKVATAFTKEHLDGQTVGLEFDVQERDQYGRALAYVWLGDVMFNKLLLDEGHASVSTYPPNVKYVDEFTAAQKAAREAGKGQWSYEAESPGKQALPSGGAMYIGNSRSMKFHTLTCEYGQQISPNNAVDLSSRDEALDAGYAPCKVCKP
ncbi:MAG: thermonuclease family protein [Clostridiales Family XIII bacterium]|jgi:micrococcal nuclease|nr:thermonuclease family protein [Clostridiales Family XIII bacterium]